MARAEDAEDAEGAGLPGAENLRVAAADPSDFWPSSGFGLLQRDARSWLVPTDAWLARFLARPELALVPESCPGETALHQALQVAPRQPVSQAQLQALADEDVRANYRLFLGFRDRLLQAGTLEGCYLALFRQGVTDTPPLFIDILAQAIVRNVLDGCREALVARAGELLFRAQRISTEGGQVLAGDREVLDMLNETGGFGDLGRLLAQAQAPLRSMRLDVLGPDNEPDYWAADQRHRHLLDLRHELHQDLGHGIHFTLKNARSGLQALALVLERWVAHLLGVEVQIEPLASVDDTQWRWHLGLDVQSTALLNDLYLGMDVEPARMQRLISLFRLRFAHPQEMRADVAGKPVYLGLAMDEAQVLKLKPQNLVLNLPLAREV
ncbi:MAG: DUF6352 family protein [Betaproteobacteria bacterium]|jgi:hypothetical protein